MPQSTRVPFLQEAGDGIWGLEAALPITSAIPEAGGRGEAVASLP